jgi:HEPN domain-containing protein
MRRQEWLEKSKQFSTSSETTLASGEFSVAYYLAGLSVECALKAKIASRFVASAIPEQKLVNEIYKNGHNLERLLQLATLDVPLAAAVVTSALLQARWQTVRQWSVDARYRQWSQAEANDMVTAVATKRNGVRAWIVRNS